MPGCYLNLGNDHFHIRFNSLFTTIEPFDAVQSALKIASLSKLQTNIKNTWYVVGTLVAEGWVRLEARREQIRCNCQQLQASAHLATCKHLENISFPFLLNTGGIIRLALLHILLFSTVRKSYCYRSWGRNKRREVLRH
jgi:hypothetical protein